MKKAQPLIRERIPFKENPIFPLLNDEYRKVAEASEEQANEILGYLDTRIYSSIDEEYFYAESEKQKSEFHFALGPVELIAGETYLHDKVSFSQWLICHCRPIATDMGFSLRKGKYILNTFVCESLNGEPIPYSKKVEFLDKCKQMLEEELKMELIFVKH